MRWYWGHGASGVLTIVAAAISLHSSSAAAGELFVMPYSCTVVGGLPRLTPSDDRGYSIIGQKEQRNYTACSPVNPSLCRQWTLYRFQLDCGGAHVPWISVAAAAATVRNGRTWVEHGRLHMEMPSRWTMASDDPCAQVSGYDYRWRSGEYARYCADRKALARGPIIEMPDGFAPMMGLDGIFVAESAAKSNPKFANSNTTTQPSAKVARNDQTRPVSAAAPSTVHAAPASTDDLRPEAKTETATAANGSANAGSDTTPRIINQASTPQTESQTKTLAENTVAQAPSSHPSQPSVVTGSVSEAAKDGPQSKGGQLAAEANSAHLSVSSNLVPDIGSTLNPTTLALGSLTALGLIVLTFMRRERAQPAFLSSRDIATVSLDARSSSREIVFPLGRPPTRFAPNAVGLQTQPASETSTYPQPVWSDHVPQTRDEALRVLGMGVGPDVNDAAIKKIIDGLRLSWHPDHAKSAADRELRELRMKQINAAWEIIAGKSPQA